MLQKPSGTDFVHQPRTSTSPEWTPLVSPIHQSVKYVPQSMAAFRHILKSRAHGFIYSRVANPTVMELEKLLAKAQGQEAGVCLSSGVAALANVALGLLNAGDHVMMFKESYKPTRYLLGSILTRLGVTSSIVSIRDFFEDDHRLKGNHLESLLDQTKPKLLFVESPTNPLSRLIDLKTLSQICKSKGVKIVLDNTVAGLHHHHVDGIDIFVHSLTKHAGGHSDAMGGAILSSEDIIQKILPTSITLGSTLDPHAAWLILRGMKTYHLRTKTASQNASEIASWLSKSHHASNVIYPGLPSSSDYALCQSQMNGDGGTVIAFDVKGDLQRRDRFIEALKIFSLTPSLGCVESLVVPCLELFADDLPPAEATTLGITDSTVRIAIGIEDSKDLIEDLSQAFILSAQS